ncbi:MAG: glycine--tRNA ligase subunit beta [Wenzhouxiangella sp.]|nr:glycine--tRNA ligase subunit beta [Wenzhouxiangella sp.]
MSERQDLLIELGCEELPARLLTAQSRGLAEGLGRRLADAGLIGDADSAQLMATPRRLAVRFPGVLARQADRELERKGPPEAQAFDAQGRPTRAAEGFARSVGRSVDELERLENEQGRWLYARVTEAGRSLAEILPECLEATVRDMAGARSMRWADRDERFLRPVRWLLVLHGSAVVPLSAFGLAADRLSLGHRIHGSGQHSLTAAGDYEAVLRRAFVLVDPSERRQRIQAQVLALAEQAGLQVRASEDLIDENAGLTEWPVAVIGDFDPAFLNVPPEALISSMQQHQKCFPLLQPDGQLAPRFIAIANIESRDPTAMVSGFERVIRPRLADARFFWDQDRRTPLAARSERLEQVLFQEKLGSIGAKTRRLRRLVADLAVHFDANAEQAQRAALLCKADLVSEMVGEFPELQGIMGMHYARHDGEDEAVALAIASHYQPRQAGDSLPTDAIGRVLAVADRLDSLVGIFAAGQKPKGGKDPFALRRSALALVRILEDSGSGLTLTEAIKLAAAALSEQIVVPESVLEEVQGFILERLKSHAADSGIETNCFQAVAAARLGSIADFMARARAVQAFADQAEGAALVAANKRASNLLKQAKGDTFGAVDGDLLTDKEESVLLTALLEIESRLSEQLKVSDYSAALTTLAELREPVDRFFEAVMVMTEDEALRRNRLALLARLRGLIADIADLARLGR